MKRNIGEMVIAGLLGVAIVTLGTASFLILNQQGNAAQDETANEEQKGEVSEIPMDKQYEMELPGFVVYTNNYSDNQVNFSSDEDYIIPFSNQRYIANSDLIGFDQISLKFARNEIYARHGRKFKDEGLQSYFENTSWYIPIYEPDEFPEELLSDIEKENALFIGSYEN